MFEAFCEDIKLDKWSFDQRYGKSLYEAIENFKASVSGNTLIQEKYSKHATCPAMSYFQSQPCPNWGVAPETLR